MERFLPFHKAMFNYIAAQDSLYDPTRLAYCAFLHPEVDLSSDCGENFKKTVSFDDIVQQLFSSRFSLSENLLSDRKVALKLQTIRNISTTSRKKHYGCLLWTANFLLSSEMIIQRTPKKS